VFINTKFDKKKVCRYNTIQNTILSQNRGERRCSGRLSSSCSTSCPRFVNSSHFHLYLPPLISVSFHCLCASIVLSFVFYIRFIVCIVSGFLYSDLLFVHLKAIDISTECTITINTCMHIVTILYCYKIAMRE